MSARGAKSKHNYSTRSANFHWFFGPHLDKLQENSLPTELDLVRLYLFKKEKYAFRNAKNLICKEIQNDLKRIWTTEANLPIQIDSTIYNSLVKLFDKAEIFSTNNKGKHQSDADWIQVQRKNCMKLFDIFACRCFIKVQSKESILPSNCSCNISKKIPLDDLNFYANQKFEFEKEKRMVISNSIDLEGSLVVQRNLNQEVRQEQEIIRLENQRLREASNIDFETIIDPTTLDLSDDSFSDSSNEKSHDGESSDETFQPSSSSATKKKNMVDYSSVVSYANRKGVPYETLSAIMNLVKLAEGEKDEEKFVSKNKLFRQSKKLGQNLSDKHSQKSGIICIKFDGKKGKSRIAHCRQEVVDKITCISEPGGHYLHHFIPEDDVEEVESGTGYNIGNGVYKVVLLYDSETTLLAVGGDNTSTNTGVKRGAFRWLQVFLGRPLQILPCLLHYVELPFKRLVTLHVGKTTGPRSRKGALGKKLADLKENLQETVAFRPITDGKMSDLHEALIDNKK